MTLSQEMHELTERSSYNLDTFKIYIEQRMRYKANGGNYHLHEYCNADDERYFVKRNRQTIIDWLKDEGFKVKISRFSNILELRIYW